MTTSPPPPPKTLQVLTKRIFKEKIDTLEDTMDQHKDTTLADILACIKEQNKEIKETKNEILAAKKETNNKLESFMGTIEMNLTEVRKDVVVLNNIMEERERESKKKNEKIEEKLLEIEKNAKIEKNNTNNRMMRIEETLKGLNFGKVKTAQLKQMENVTVQPARRERTKSPIGEK